MFCSGRLVCLIVLAVVRKVIPNNIPPALKADSVSNAS